MLPASGPDPRAGYTRTFPKGRPRAPACADTPAVGRGQHDPRPGVGSGGLAAPQPGRPDLGPDGERLPHHPVSSHQPLVMISLRWADGRNLQGLEDAGITFVPGRYSHVPERQWDRFATREASVVWAAVGRTGNGGAGRKGRSGGVEGAERGGRVVGGGDERPAVGTPPPRSGGEMAATAGARGRSPSRPPSPIGGGCRPEGTTGGGPQAPATAGSFARPCARRPPPPPPAPPPYRGGRPRNRMLRAGHNIPSAHCRRSRVSLLPLKGPYGGEPALGRDLVKPGGRLGRWRGRRHPLSRR